MPTWWMARVSTPRSYPVTGAGLLGKADGARRADRLGRVRLALDAGPELLEAGPVQRLPVEQRAGEAVESGPVLRDEALRLLVGGVRQARLLVVAQPLRLLGERVVVGPHRPRGRRR